MSRNVSPYELKTTLEQALAAVGVQDATLAQELRAALASLDSETTARADHDGAPHGVGWVAEHPLLSRLQSSLAARPMPDVGSNGEPAGRSVQFDDHDVGGWMKSVFQHWRSLRPHAFLEPDRAEVLPIPDDARLALFSDWGSGRYGAPVLAATLRKDPRRIDAIIHLGDVYYAGTIEEVQQNLLALWPHREDARSLLLNGNHEMYGGGHGYYQALEKLGQPHSYFALQNSHFTIIGLDTAYEDHELAGRQAQWLKDIAAQAGERRIILLSHHQPFSAFECDGPRLREQMKEVLESRRVLCWYWGHEHHCTLYSAVEPWGLWGRCIGHGGYPYFRIRPKRGWETQKRQAESTWYAFPASDDAPGGIVLGDPNPYVAPAEDPERYGAQGYVTLELDGPRLHELFCRPDGTIILQQELARAAAPR